MKFLAILLSVVMLAMAFDLCLDEDSCGESCNTELSGQEDRTTSNDDAICSPFCHCVTCPFSILLPSKISSIPKAASSQQRYTDISESVTLNVKNAVWQPPKAA
ncbi:MAG: DUF6660 family protein [Bacteroidota bacterium]